jgi:MerR family transcriptional regulator, copper efflux regulator
MKPARRHLQLAPRGDCVPPGPDGSDGFGTQAAATQAAATPAATRPLLQVGDLARLTGKTVRALHHYEELGLIEPVARSKGHYRLYHPETPARIRWIGKLSSLGISLTEIQELVRRRRGSGSARQSAEDLRNAYTTLLEAVDLRLTQLQALREELQTSVDYLDECHTLCTPPLGPSDCMTCNRHPEPEPSDLIAGALY